MPELSPAPPFGVSGTNEAVLTWGGGAAAGAALTPASCGTGAAAAACRAAAVPAPRRGGSASAALDPLRLQLLHEVPMGVTVQLGSTRMTVRELLALAPGSVVELDRAAGSPVDVLVNGTLLARGEVVVVDEKFGVRVMEVVSRAKRLASLA